MLIEWIQYRKFATGLKFDLILNQATTVKHTPPVGYDFTKYKYWDFFFRDPDYLDISICRRQSQVSIGLYGISSMLNISYFLLSSWILNFFPGFRVLTERLYFTYMLFCNVRVVVVICNMQLASLCIIVSVSSSIEKSSEILFIFWIVWKFFALTGFDLDHLCMRNPT